MPVPEFKNCLVCEDVRPEQNRLVTLLGFFGLVPEVAILFKDFKKPLRKLCFVVIGGPGDLKGKVNIQILDQHNQVVAVSSDLDVDLKTAPETVTNMIFFVENIHFREPGKHRIIVKMGDLKLFDSTFGIKLGQTSDFSG